jgi:hypothetical protein
VARPLATEIFGLNLCIRALDASAIVHHNDCMHALLFVLGDKVHEQLQPHLLKHMDFYVIGGRWSGILPKRKPDGTIKNVDSLRAGQIAWDEAYAETEQKARAVFAEWRQIFERHGRPKSRLEISRELGLEIGRFGKYPPEVYEAYREQPALLAYDEAHPDNIYCPINAFGFDEDEYLQSVIDDRLTPNALVIAGKWIEQPLGLDPEPQWAAAVRDRLLSVPPDTRVTAIDYHF